MVCLRSAIRRQSIITEAELDIADNSITGDITLPEELQDFDISVWLRDPEDHCENNMEIKHEQQDVESIGARFGDVTIGQNQMVCDDVKVEKDGGFVEKDGGFVEKGGFVGLSQNLNSTGEKMGNHILERGEENPLVDFHGSQGILENIRVEGIQECDKNLIFGEKNVFLSENHDSEGKVNDGFCGSGGNGKNHVFDGKTINDVFEFGRNVKEEHVDEENHCVPSEEGNGIEEGNVIEEGVVFMQDEGDVVGGNKDTGDIKVESRDEIDYSSESDLSLRSEGGKNGIQLDEKLGGDTDLEEGEIRTAEDSEPKGGGKKVYDDVLDSDEEEQVRKPYEKEVLPPVPVVKESLQPHHITIPAGVVTSVLGTSVVVEGIECPRALNEGTILWVTEKRSPLGFIDEVFGPVKNPFYLVRFNTDADVPDYVEEGVRISYVSEFAKFLLDDDPSLYEKGYDIYGDCEEELSDEAVFSDDEKEAEFYRSKGMTKRGPNTPDKSPHKPFERQGKHEVVDKRKKNFDGRKGNYQRNNVNRTDEQSQQGSFPMQQTFKGFNQPPVTAKQRKNVTGSKQSSSQQWASSPTHYNDSEKVSKGGQQANFNKNNGRNKEIGVPQTKTKNFNKEQSLNFHPPFPGPQNSTSNENNYGQVSYKMQSTPHSLPSRSSVGMGSCQNSPSSVDFSVRPMHHMGSNAMEFSGRPSYPTGFMHQIQSNGIPNFGQTMSSNGAPGFGQPATNNGNPGFQQPTVSYGNSGFRQPAMSNNNQGSGRQTSPNVNSGFGQGAVPNGNQGFVQAPTNTSIPGYAQPAQFNGNPGFRQSAPSNGIHGFGMPGQSIVNHGFGQPMQFNGTSGFGQPMPSNGMPGFRQPAPSNSIPSGMPYGGFNNAQSNQQTILQQVPAFNVNQGASAGFQPGIPAAQWNAFGVPQMPVWNANQGLQNQFSINQMHSCVGIPVEQGPGGNMGANQAGVFQYQNPAHPMQYQQFTHAPPRGNPNQKIPGSPGANNFHAQPNSSQCVNFPRQPTQGSKGNTYMSYTQTNNQSTGNQ